jgi:sporulation protein YlmC with PRC-barrel domain
MARVDRVYGNEVISSDNQKLGRLNNLMVDLESGRILYAVIGEISGRVAVAPQIFTSTQPVNKELRVTEAKSKVNSAPKFNAEIDVAPEWGKTKLTENVYAHFGQPIWWQSTGPSDQGAFHNVHKASTVIGMKVKDASDRPLGKVEEMVVNLPAGRIGYVILAPDASLKLGNNLYALPPQAFTLSADQQTLVSGLDLNTLSSGPHFSANNWPNLSDASFASQVYQHYGKQAWFQSGSSPATR